jgi:UDP:flavonoid glycosyltransferase YjiC (YdhE family)
MPQTDYILATLGSAGDVNPMIALGRELQRRGHRVTLAAHGYHRARAEAAGLELAEMGTREEFEAIMQHPDLWHPLRGFQLLATLGIPSMLRPVYDMAASRDPSRTVLVGSSLILAGRIAAQKLGMRHITVHLQPSVIQSLDDTPNLAPPLTDMRWPRAFRRIVMAYVNRLGVDRLVGPPVNAFRAELGLPPERGFFADKMHSPLLTLGLWPDWYAPKQPDWPASIVNTGFVRYDAPAGHAAPDGLEAFLAAGAPPLVFTPGTAMVQGESFFAAAVEASQRLGRRAILLSPHREQLPPNLAELESRGIAHFDYIPFSEVLSRAAALIYHGGIGSLAQAIAAGIPQLVMPMAHDQPDNARRVKDLGIGDFLSPARFRGPAVARKLDALLGNPEIRRRATELGGRIDFDAALQEACDRIEGLPVSS